MDFVIQLTAQVFAEVIRVSIFEFVGLNRAKTATMFVKQRLRFLWGN